MICYISKRRLIQTLRIQQNFNFLGTLVKLNCKKGKHFNSLEIVLDLESIKLDSSLDFHKTATWTWASP